MTVTANSVNDTVNLGGNFQTPGLTREGGNAASGSWKPKLSGFGGGTSTKDGESAVGIAAMVFDTRNHAIAKIEDRVSLYGDSLEVTASSKSMNIALGASGGESDNFALNGAFVINLLTDQTLAQVDAGANV